MFIPLHVHSHYSLLDGLSKPQQIFKRCIKLGYNACALTDHGTIAGAVSFMKACKEDKKKNKPGIKPILGCEFYLTPLPANIKNASNRKLSHLVVLAKNLQGWKQLIKATSASNKEENVYYNKPRLQLEELAEFAQGQWITFSGHMGSDLANVLFKDLKLAYNAKSIEEARLHLVEGYEDKAVKLAKKYEKLFGKGNFYIEIQRIDIKNLPAAWVVSEILREVSDITGIPKVATPDAHYCEKEDAADQRILLSSALETTLTVIQKKIDAQEDVTLGAFFKSNNYHIPSLAEMQELHTQDELDNTVKIADQCESYDILGKPTVPSFPTPNGISSIDYIRELCRKGWEKKIAHKVPKELHQKYKDRVEYELGVIGGYQLLADYFLIVQDYMSWARARMLCGKGRGSGAGCLVSDLLGITDIDPLEYNLLFERFYNAGRNTAERISLPDVDCDFPISRRAEVKAYIKSRIGEDRVCEMITFSRMQGRGALKDVLRAHETCSYDEMNKITEFIPDEAEISDELQLMREAGKEPSIVMWALENNPEQLKQWCYIEKDGSLQGPLAKRFAQAIRLEGTKRSQGKHAAGIVISASSLPEVCPMVFDKSTKQLIAGMEMNDLEAMGHVKFDILGVAVLDKMMGCASLVRTGKLV